MHVTYANYLMCRYQKTMSVYLHHINSMQPTVPSQALVYLHLTLLAYAPEQICLPHYTCSSHCINNVVDMYTPQYCTYPSNINKLELFIYHTTAKYVPATKYALKCNSTVICPNYLTSINGGSISIYMPNMNSLASVMWPGVLYTEDNADYNANTLPQSNCIDWFGNYIKLAKNNKLQLLFTMLYQYIC